MLAPERGNVARLGGVGQGFHEFGQVLEHGVFLLLAMSARPAGRVRGEVKNRAKVRSKLTPHRHEGSRGRSPWG